MSLTGNAIWTVSSTGLDYWAAHIGGEKKHTDLKYTPVPMTLPFNDVP